MIQITVNGETLQTEILGFKVLQITGREAYGSEINEHSITNVDGSMYQGRRYPARDIVVTYTLHSPTKEAYRIRQNRLNALLEPAQSMVVFSDEPDKYFVATATDCDATTITFHCTDPYKYSLTTKSVQATPDSNGLLYALVENNGVPTFVDYEITNQADNGYFGIVSSQGAIELGNRDQVQYETYTFDQKLASLSTLANGTQVDSTGRITSKTTTASGSKTLKLRANVVANYTYSADQWCDVQCTFTQSNGKVNWSMSAEQTTEWGRRFSGTTRNNGGTIQVLVNGSVVNSTVIKYVNYNQGKGTASASGSVNASGTVTIGLKMVRGTGGETGMRGDSEIWVYGNAETSSTISSLSCTGLTCTTPSSSTTTSYRRGNLCGGYLKCTIPSDKTGHSGSQNFYFSGKFYFATERAGQTGSITMHFCDASGNVVCGLGIYKTDRGGNHANVCAKGPTTDVKTWSFDSATAPFLNENFEITKTGGTVYFKSKVGTYSYYNAAIASTEVTQIELLIGNYTDRYSPINTTWVPHMALVDMSFTKKNGTQTVKSGNLLTAGDRINITGNSGRITKNGLYTPELEVLGSEYFKIPNGTTRIEFLKSSWCTDNPNVYIKYRERYR